jgi:hypothetical protein
MFDLNDNISELYLSNPSRLDMNRLSAIAAPQLVGKQYINSSTASYPALSPNTYIEGYATCGGGPATLNRAQYYPGDPQRYRNNNEECLTNNHCASGYCNKTISGSPAQNIYNAWNQPNYQIGMCADVDNGLPSDIRPVIPRQEIDIDITIDDVRAIKENYREGVDRNFDDLFNDCIYQTYWNGVPESYPPLKLAPSCRMIVSKYKKASDADSVRARPEHYLHPHRRQ